LLQQVATRLTAEKVTSFEITGHPDSEGSDSYNLQLSDRRAAGVKTQLQALMGSGVTIATKGPGETKPIADYTTKAGQAKNRRVEIRVTSG
jgi:outer membrane protein OmpA-like peptidoglycan-associated protein